MPTRRAWLALTLLATFAGFAPAAAKNMTFEIYPDAKSEYRWRLKDADGNIVATSGQGYSKKADCTDMVDKFKADISKYKFDVYEDDGKTKKFRFRIKASNGNVVGSSSKAYDTKADAEKVVDAIKKDVKNADKVEKAKEKD
jgi:uncharacterized protein YegP (UPF0339 family)